MFAAHSDDSRLQIKLWEIHIDPVVQEKILEHHVLEASGERQLESVRQLILRGRQLSSFDSACASRLQNLVVLSLSNNRVQDLEGFQFLVSLVDLNLNFNAVTSLDGMCCPRLQKLFLSNNLVANLATLKKFPRLQTLCLFKNILPDLSAALESLRGLPGLRELDLDGNPCARSRGYQHRVLRSCPRLRELDGEEITQLDRDLSALFIEEQEKKGSWRRCTPMSPGTGSSPPVTAPGMPGSFATKFEMKGCRSHGVAAPKERSNVSRSRLPLEKTRLFPSDRLGNDPQLLTYLAQGVLEDPCGSPWDVLESLRQRPTSSSETGPCCSQGGARRQSAFAKEVGEEKREGEEKEQAMHGMSSIEATSPSEILTASAPVMVAFASNTDIEIDSRKLVDEVDGSGDGGRPGREDGFVVLASPGVGASRVNERSDAGDTKDGGCASVVGETSQRAQRETEWTDSSSRQGTTDADESSCGFVSTKDELPVTAEAGSFSAVESGGKGESSGASILSGDKLAREAETSSADSAGGEDRERGEAELRLSERREMDTLRVGRSRPQQPPPPPLPVPLFQSRANDLDPSNPFATIRMLLKVIEILQLERAQCSDHHRQGGLDDLLSTYTRHFDPVDDSERAGSKYREDIRRLRLENRNMHFLLIENRELKRQAREEATRAEDQRHVLRAEVERLRGRLRGVLVAELDRASPRSSEGASETTQQIPRGEIAGLSRCPGGSGHAASRVRRRESIALAASTPRSPDPQTENTENDEEGDLDEIEKLIRRNQWNMGQIRCDLDLMRRETFVESPPRPPAVVIPQQQQQALSTKPAALAGILASEPKARRDDEVIKPRALVASPPDKNASETTTQERLQGEMSRKLLRCTDNGEGTTVSACRENIVRGDSTLRRETEPPSVVELLRLTRLVDSQVTASGGTDNGGDRESENPRRVDGLSTGGYPTPCCPQPLSRYLSVQPMDGKRLTPEENSTSSGSSDRSSAIRLDEPLSILLRSRQDDSGCCYGRGRSESKGVAARSRRGARGKSTAKAEEVKGLCEREEYLYRDRAPAVASDLGTEEDWREKDGGGRVTFAAANIRELLVSEDHPCSPKL